MNDTTKTGDANMRQALWAYLALWGALILLCLVAPRLAFAGARGIMGGNWESWNRRILAILQN